MFDKLLDLARHLVHPVMFMALSGYCGIRTLFRLLFQFQFRTLLSISAFKETWFASFWSVYGPGIPPEPVEPMVKKAYGVVLDIGICFF